MQVNCRLFGLDYVIAIGVKASHQLCCPKEKGLLAGKQVCMQFFSLLVYYLLAFNVVCIVFYHRLVHLCLPCCTPHF